MGSNKVVDAPVYIKNRQLLDRKGFVVIPNMTWKGDIQHTEKQARVLELIAALINQHFGKLRAMDKSTLDKI